MGEVHGGLERYRTLLPVMLCLGAECSGHEELHGAKLHAMEPHDEAMQVAGPSHYANCIFA